MKKSIFSAAIILLFCLLLTSCGKQATNGPTGSTTYSDLACESQSLYNVTGSKYAHCLGTQYYQGEAIQLWSDVDESGRQSEIYAYKGDGSSKLLFEGMDRNFYLSASGYLDNEGNLYSWRSLEPLIYKTSPSGEQLYAREFTEIKTVFIRDMCQTSDGRIFVCCLDNQSGNRTLGELNPDTGDISALTKVTNGISYLGAGEEGLFLIDQNNLWKVDTEDGSLKEQLSFAGTTYVSHKLDTDIQDFRVTEDQGIKLLRTDILGDHWQLETVWQVKLDVGKTVLTLRGNFKNRSWIKEQINAFNLSDSKYYVVMEDSENYMDNEECARLTSVEIATGKGPDLLYGDVLGKYLFGVIQKGGLEDLAPYIKKSGIKEKDYFSAAFNRWRDGKKIYGICVSLKGMTYYMDSTILGTDKEPNIELLAEALLAHEGNEVFYYYSDAQEILRMLLEGSKDLWGMIDWKKETCDFSGELFADLLKTAKRYEYDGRELVTGSQRYGYENWKISSEILNYNMYSAYNYQDPEILKKRGIVEVLGMFDDGVHGIAGASSITLSINVNSANKQGAWEFIQFLLREEAQMNNPDFPVNRQTCRTYLKNVLESANVRYNTDSVFILTEERIEYLMEDLGNMRFTPMRTEPILDIICDEAENYFNGTKSIDQIIPVIQNRVKLYLEETGS